jgi:hypothetical protein
MTKGTNLDWAMNDKGYVCGGFDTPIFEAAKKEHNRKITKRKHARKNTNQEKK